MGKLAFVKDFGAIEASDIDQIASQLGKELTNITVPNQKYPTSLKTNQIRNIYSHINMLRTKFRMAKCEKEQSAKDKIYKDISRELILLKPKLAYAKGRKPNEVKPFQEFMFELIDKTTCSTNICQSLENFFIMVESIVAYHKFNNGKDN